LLLDSVRTGVYGCKYPCLLSTIDPGIMCMTRSCIPDTSSAQL
jgi:hypothetical protein